VNAASVESTDERRVAADDEVVAAVAGSVSAGLLAGSVGGGSLSVTATHTMNE
jgi:outer membrane lipoprotein SlyB